MMKKAGWWTAICLCLGLHVVISSTYSPARALNLPQTGQFKCYSTAAVSYGGNVWSVSTKEVPCAGTAQDGEFRQGVAWPNPRFVDNNDGTVTDRLSGLMWTKDASLMRSRNPEFDQDVWTEYGWNESVAGDGKVTWQHALDYVQLLNSDHFAQYDDWRLPNTREMGSLEFVGSAFSCLGFSTTQDHCLDLSFDNMELSYWTSTSNPLRPGEAFFLIGAQSSSDPKGRNKAVWAVRGTTAGETALARTGQTKCYSEAGVEIACAGTGQDGALQAGISWPEHRFVPQEDTITDALTGLMWPKNVNTPGPSVCSPGVARTWGEVPAYLRCLNREGYLGYSDWRIPNILENSSLSDWGIEDPSALLSGKGFLAPPHDLWWSSNPWGFMMWVGIFGTGGWDTWGYPGNVCPVRGGASAALPQYTVSVSLLGDRDHFMICTPGLVTQGENTTCTIPAGYQLLQLLDNALDVTSLTSQNTYSLKDVREDHRLVAIIERAPTLVEVVINGPGSGRITSTPEGINCLTGSENGCVAPFPEDLVILLLPTPDYDSQFAGWEGLCTGTGPCVASVVSPDSLARMQVKATFTRLPKARIGSKDYSTIEMAFADAASGATILARDLATTEDLVWSRDASIMLDGGYDATFDSHTDSPTVLRGVVRISSGKLTVKNIVLR